MRWLLSLSLLALVGGPALAQAKREPLAERVKSAIDKSVRWLRENQRANGGWEVDLPSAGIHGGWTALATLSLLNAGVPVSDPMMVKALEFLRKLDTSSVYVRSLQTMVFVEAKQPEDKVRIGENVRWLVNARVVDGGALTGWSYTDKLAAITDNSNTQYALLGLWAGTQAGIEVKKEIWESIRQYYLRTHLKDGGWPYTTKELGGRVESSMTMTTAGICGLLIAGMEMTVPCASTGLPGATRPCGEYADVEAIGKAKSWVSQRFVVDLPQRAFYHIYGLERTGRLSGDRFFGPFDWYREGCQWLVEHQKANGSFEGAGQWDKWPTVSTSFALLFMSKGRTPVLVSKMVHGPWEVGATRVGRREEDQDWNSDRNDLRHLVSFSSKHLFKDLPLAWQTFDMMQAASSFRVLNDDAIADITSELLQSPVLYITGHKSLLRRITGVEKKILKCYIESGGFIVVDACCSSKEFDEGFKQLVKEDSLWPDNDLSPLDSKHPVWKSEFLVNPGDPFPLYGISMGCKTVLIYSPKDLSCFWEAGPKWMKDEPTGKADRAFKLGANILAYATGKEPPKPRLTEIGVVHGKDDPAIIPRGFLRIAQIKHGGDWHPAPNAMRNLVDHVGKYAGINVVRQTDEVTVYSRNLLKYKFLYMHGKAPFTFVEEDLEYLRFALEKGGSLLFADACCGSEAFDKSFRAFMEKLFPDGKLKLERMPEDDLLFSKRLSNLDISPATIRGRTKIGEEPKAMAPYLEGIRIDGRWVVLYSKYDIGCALERHSSSDCLGYTPDSAQMIATAAVMYTFWPGWKD